MDFEQSKKVWYKLIEQNYSIEKIIISADNILSIDIIFLKISDLEKFRELIFDMMYFDIYKTCDSTKFTLFVNIDLNFLEKIVYPKSTKEINIFKVFDTNKIINLGQLPPELKKLIIISSVPFDLTNLPNQLEILDLSGCTGWKKFNLDYLPESLKLLKLPYTDEMGGKTIYEVKDLQNLPITLNEIYIGNMFFNSVEDVLQKYKVKKSFQRK